MACYPRNIFTEFKILILSCCNIEKKKCLVSNIKCLLSLAWVTKKIKPAVPDGIRSAEKKASFNFPKGNSYLQIRGCDTVLENLAKRIYPNISVSRICLEQSVWKMNWNDRHSKKFGRRNPTELSSYRIWITYLIITFPNHKRQSWRFTQENLNGFLTGLPNRKTLGPRQSIGKTGKQTSRLTSALGASVRMSIPRETFLRMSHAFNLKHMLSAFRFFSNF